MSVILTTLNSARFVERSIRSCLEQTHGDLELIVVDGGSTDGTLEIVEDFDDSRIRVLHQANNEGKLPGALNLGMADARGAYITWTQDDCWYDRSAIATMLSFLDDHPEVGLVYADYWDVDAEGQVTRYQRVNPPEALTRDLRDDVVRQCFLFRREVYETVGPQPVEYFPVHEVPWRLRVAEAFRIAPLHIPLMKYMVHNSSLTGQIGAWELQREVARVLHDAGYLNRRRFRERLGSIDIGQAFDSFVLRGDTLGLWRYAVAGMARYPPSLRNRGLWKMLLRSLLPGHRRYQATLSADWVAVDRADQMRFEAQGRAVLDTVRLTSLPSNDAEVVSRER